MARKRNTEKARAVRDAFLEVAATSLHTQDAEKKIAAKLGIPQTNVHAQLFKTIPRNHTHLMSPEFVTARRLLAQKGKSKLGRTAMQRPSYLLADTPWRLEEATAALLNLHERLDEARDLREILEQENDQLKKRLTGLENDVAIAQQAAKDAEAEREKLTKTAEEEAELRAALDAIRERTGHTRPQDLGKVYDRLTKPIRIALMRYGYRFVRQQGDAGHVRFKGPRGNVSVVLGNQEKNEDRILNDIRRGCNR